MRHCRSLGRLGLWNFCAIPLPWGRLSTSAISEAQRQLWTRCPLAQDKTNCELKSHPIHVEFGGICCHYSLILFEILLYFYKQAGAPTVPSPGATADRFPKRKLFDRRFPRRGSGPGWLLAGDIKRVLRAQFCTRARRF